MQVPGTSVFVGSTGPHAPGRNYVTLQYAELELESGEAKTLNWSGINGEVYIGFAMLNDAEVVTEAPADLELSFAHTPVSVRGWPGGGVVIFPDQNQAIQLTLTNHGSAQQAAYIYADRRVK